MSPFRATALVSLTIADQVVYTVYEDRVLRLTQVHLANVTNADHDAVIYFAPDGVAASAQNTVYDCTLDANTFVEFGDGLMLPAGTQIIANCDVDNAVTLMISGEET